MAIAATAELDEAAEAPKKSSKLALVLSLVLCLAGGGLGFFAVSSGLVPLGNSEPQEAPPETEVSPLPDVVFVPIPTLLVTLPPGAENKHLRFTAQIEVVKGHEADVEFLMPRITDLMNGYLRALSADDIEGAGALFKIRLQLFRRVVMVVGLGKVNGLLVTEFILN